MALERTQHVAAHRVENLDLAIAAAAGLSTGAIYLYFKSKEDFGVAVIETSTVTVVPAVNQLEPGAVSLTPAGNLRWNNVGNPYLYEHGSIGTESQVGVTERIFMGGLIQVDRGLGPNFSWASRHEWPTIRSRTATSMSASAR